MQQKGVFTISLDFEMYWGVRDVVEYENYKENLDNTRVVVLKLLELFEKYEVHATWAIVGFLFLKDLNELEKRIPDSIPTYQDGNLSPYGAFPLLKEKNLSNVLFASDLIQLILQSPYQEIGTHTFSHYYCLEPGQNKDNFRSDISAACQLAREFGLQLESIVFPRNQVNDNYLRICNDYNIRCFRGNENGYIYRASRGSQQTMLKRALRLLDSYINLSGFHTYDLPLQKGAQEILNIPASRFFRPYSSELRFLEKIKIRRIKQGMLQAAKKKALYHLWWHPHNFGKNINENFDQLESILEYYTVLNKMFELQSKNMSEIYKDSVKI